MIVSRVTADPAPSSGCARRAGSQRCEPRPHARGLRPDRRPRVRGEALAAPLRCDRRGSAARVRAVCMCISLLRLSEGIEPNDAVRCRQQPRCHARVCRKNDARAQAGKRCHGADRTVRGAARRAPFSQRFACAFLGRRRPSVRPVSSVPRARGRRPRRPIRLWPRGRHRNRERRA
jgi:hypothetical protein